MIAAEDLEWIHVYYVCGSSPKGSVHRYDVSDPPCSGWQHALLIPGVKRATLFCPFTLQAYSVRPNCAEVATAREPKDFPRDYVVGLIHEKWAEMQARGWARDYDTAALVLRRLGAEVPVQVMRGGEEDTRRKGGKEVAVSLEKPVKRSGKRGKFLEWFLAGGGSRAVREAMAEFGMSRSNALSYLYMLQKDHGIGYDLVGDVATVRLPDGCVNPFDDPGFEGVEPAAPTTPTEDDGAWLDGGADNDVDDDSWLE